MTICAKVTGGSPACQSRRPGWVNFRFNSGGISFLRKDDLFHNHQISELNNIRHLTAQ